VKASPATSKLTPVRRRPSLDFSLTGLVYCSMMMFMGLAAINSQANLLFGVFGLMIGILVVSFIISRVVLRGLRVRRILPDNGVVGKAMIVNYEFVNNKHYWPSLSVSLAELDGVEGFVRQPQAYLLHAAARMRATVPVEVVPKRRGLHHLRRYQLATSFPFGFIKRAVEREDPDQFMVFPATGAVSPKLLQLCRSAERSGAMMRPRRGGMDEFYGVKEFRSGENPRWIYWRRSARTGTLVAKEMTQVAPPRLLLLVDTFVEQATDEELTEVERVIAMAASLLSEGLESGLMIGIYAWGGTDWVGLHPNRGKRQRRDALAALARLPLNTKKDTRELLHMAERFMKTGTTPVLFTLRDLPVSLRDHLRTGLVVVSSVNPQSRSWFTFDPKIDFSVAMPLESTEAGRRPAGSGQA
jgi:uncharacterized protein (DUF58 family)